MKVKVLIVENLYEMVGEEYGDHKSDEFRMVLFPPVRKCSGCTLCCKILGIPEFEKPREIWCKHCQVGVGCKVYESRPASCSNFTCLWLAGY